MKIKVFVGTWLIVPHPLIPLSCEERGKYYKRGFAPLMHPLKKGRV